MPVGERYYHFPRPRGAPAAGASTAPGGSRAAGGASSEIRPCALPYEGAEDARMGAAKFYKLPTSFKLYDAGFRCCFATDPTAP